MYTKLGTDYRLYNGNYYEVNAKNSGINERILNSFLGQLAVMENRHNKLFVYIFILDVKDSYDTNAIMKAFNIKLDRHLAKYQKTKEMAYHWVREKVDNKPEHYHQVLILNGNRIQNIKHIYQPMIDIWKSVGGSNIHRPVNPYYNYRRGDYQTLADIIYRVSYFAKNATKGNKPAQTKNYGTSRIK
ncbi:YagK/YfjJ domain-containing protein [Pseudocolwellia sp. HL-MZ7]|uniref:YagK/YfjJ domain-containing protein n=1 Tax=Pseudocolwellia sp. HL-MZ7 TaxID=3400627 RepID=UPI003CEA9276